MNVTLSQTFAKECIVKAGTAIGNISLEQHVQLKFSFHEGGLSQLSSKICMEEPKQRHFKAWPSGN